MGLVTGTGLIPPAYAGDDPASAIRALLDRLTTATTFTGPLLSSAVLGGDPAYDGPFYKDRSPINVIKKVKVPTFLVSGEYDLFQRGTPLLFEKLQKRGVPVRMITGPWDHLQGSSGEDVGEAGYGGLQELWLRWFDRYVKGKKDAKLLKDIKPFTYYEQGTGKWVTTRKYVDRDLHAASFRLSGDAAVGGRNGGLVLKGARAGLARHVDGAADPGHRAVHALGEPVDRRHPQPGVPRQPVPEGQRAQRPRRAELPDRAAAEGAAAPGADQRAALRVLAQR